MLQCLGCGAFYHRRHWTLTKPTGFDFSVRVRSCYCPACRKIKDLRASGELEPASFNGNERKDVLRILRNEEGRAREKNPLERIMRIEEVNSGWNVQTTTKARAALGPRRAQSARRQAPVQVVTQQ
jgi:hypothetical protein